MKLQTVFSELLNEDFKTQTRRFIDQGIDPQIVSTYINNFKHIRDKKYKEMFDTKLEIPVPPDKRNDIDSYKDFHDLEQLVDYVSGQRPVSSNFSKSDEKIEVSGKPVYKDENFEVYYADNPRACIEYKGKFPYSWCVARSDSSNMFYTYRFKPYEPAFYFVKDIKAAEKEFGIWNMTKNVFQGKFKNPYHFFVIQVPKNAKMDDDTTPQYIVTSANNDGDKEMSWNKLLKLNPNIGPIREVLVPKPFTPEEKQKHEMFKNGISDEQFKRLTYEDKRSYLDIYPTIARPITNGQLMELPEDLLNLYVSFGIGLDDKGFAYVKTKPAILKRYTQISKRKLEEFLKEDPRTRNQLKMAYSELIVLSDSDIVSYLKSLSNSEIIDFIHRFGEDKFEFLEKHLPDKFSNEHKSIRTLLSNANSGSEEAYEKIKEMIPDQIELKFYDGYIIFDTGNYGTKILQKEMDNDVASFYRLVENDYWNDGYGSYNDYFDGDSENLEERYTQYIEEVIGDNESLGNDVKAVGLEWNVETIKDLFETYKKKEDIKSDINRIYSEAQDNGENYVWSKIRSEIRSIIFIDDDSEVNIKIGVLVFFLSKNKFFTTDVENFINNLVFLLENILEDYGVPSDDNDIWEKVRQEGYENMEINDSEITKSIEEAIEETLENFLGDDDEDNHSGNDESKLAKLKSQIITSLNNVLKGLGKDPFSKHIENEIVSIDIDRNKFNLDGKVFVKLTDKKTGKSHDGYVFIKDIPSYFTNYKLFEQLSRMKSLIKY